MHDYYNLRYYGKNGFIELTVTENIILDLLLNNKNKVVTYEKLAKNIYHLKLDDSLKRCIEVNISRLRQKLKNEVVINTKYGIGYTICI